MCKKNTHILTEKERKESSSVLEALKCGDYLYCKVVQKLEN